MQVAAHRHTHHFRRYLAQSVYLLPEEVEFVLRGSSPCSRHTALTGEKLQQTIRIIRLLRSFLTPSEEFLSRLFVCCRSWSGKHLPFSGNSPEGCGRCPQNNTPIFFSIQWPWILKGSDGFDSTKPRQPQCWATRWTCKGISVKECLYSSC